MIYATMQKFPIKNGTYTLFDGEARIHVRDN